MHHSHGKRKAEVAAARFDKHEKCRASPAVLSEECFRCFCSSLESHESAPLLFTDVMRGSDSDLLLAVSPSVSSMSGSVVMTSSDMPSSSSLTTPQQTTITRSLLLEEGVWSNSYSGTSFRNGKED